VAVLHAIVSGKCDLITDRRRTCRGPVHRPLIKMADNSVSACMGQRVVKFLVNKGGYLQKTSSTVR
jgi:uracil-DNA glycosylase